MRSASRPHREAPGQSSLSSELMACASGAELVCGDFYLFHRRITGLGSTTVPRVATAVLPSLGLSFLSYKKCSDTLNGEESQAP